MVQWQRKHSSNKRVQNIVPQSKWAFTLVITKFDGLSHDIFRNTLLPRRFFRRLCIEQSHLSGLPSIRKVCNWDKPTKTSLPKCSIRFATKWSVFMRWADVAEINSANRLTFDRSVPCSSLNNVLHFIRIYYFSRNLNRIEIDWSKWHQLRILTGGM